eukprot:TRINITY_DN1793_c0_g2_i1.p1 TRINITY_DN1793_c0_g2~~TRINITY_DN1793_c0_g2_i1.p1  ORF type:complete len:161 (+),score=26.11 TRINITY_DN1793_c0_g2_i1:157-639(+)
MVIFFALVGVLGCCVGLVSSTSDAGCNQGYCGDCYWCVWCDCHHDVCHCPHHCDCGSCDCAKCDADAGPVMLVLAAVVCIVLAFVGLIIALFFMAMVIQRVLQRHMHVLQKRTLAQHYLVQDLDGQDLQALQTNNKSPDLQAPPGPASYTHLTLPTIYSV